MSFVFLTLYIPMLLNSILKNNNLPVSDGPLSVGDVKVLTECFLSILDRTS